MPSGMKNLHKYKDVVDIVNNNHISTFLETGCAINEKPKLFTSDQKICANNPAQTDINSKYIHNGKGTAILKKDYIKTQPTSRAFNNDK